MIPPTEQNLIRYEEWVMSSSQSEIFFGDMVPKCYIANIKEGDTLYRYACTVGQTVSVKLLYSDHPSKDLRTVTVKPPYSDHLNKNLRTVTVKPLYSDHPSKDLHTVTVK